LSWGSFSNHGNNVKDLSVTVSESVFSSFEGSDMGGKFGEGAGLGLEESGINNFESIGHDGSSLMHHSSNSIMFGNNGVEVFNISVIFIIEIFSGFFSCFKFSFFITSFSNSVLKNWLVDHNKTLIFGDLCFKRIDFSIERVHIISAGISNDTISISNLGLLISETFSYFFDHLDDMADVISGVGLKFNFNGCGESGTEIRFFDFSKDVLGGKCHSRRNH
jgi:hypothetical protein